MSMKVLIIGNKDRYDKFMPDTDIFDRLELVFCARDSSDEDILAMGKDAHILLVDAICTVDARLINEMPNLIMIHSEGVAYNGIDLEAARARGIYVCNNKGCNADSVAEQTVLLMLACLRSVVAGDREVRAGGQIQMKERMMVEGITDIEDCRIGLIGFGDIAKATAKRLSAFGSSLFYYSLHRKSDEIEREYNVQYLPLEEIAAKCDIISIHAAVTKETTGLIDEHFLSLVKPSAYIINTARGEIIDNYALRSALIEGRIAGAGLDTIAPEPVAADNPLVSLPEGCRDKVILSPHLGGISTGSFRKIYRSLWGNVERVMNGERPVNIVNGL